MATGKLITTEDAVPSAVQHRKPCSDCPWRRDSLAGWLGDQSKEAWLQDVHGEARIDCHTLIGPQCAGAAIFRSNVCKSPRDGSLLILPVDKERVFATSAEFSNHHDMARVARELEGKPKVSMHYHYSVCFADGRLKEIARSTRVYTAAWQIKTKEIGGNGEVRTHSGFARDEDLAEKSAHREARASYGNRWRDGRRVKVQFEVVSVDIVPVTPVVVK